MGRLSNAVSIRLGNKLLWLNNGIYIRKINCVKYIHFINNIINLINVRVQKKNYLFAKVELFQEKSNLLVNIYFYRKEINLFVIKKNKVNNNIKKIKK